MKILQSALVLVATTVSLAMKSQSVDDIVAKHVAAIGGKDALSKIKSMTIESDVAVMGQNFPAVTSILVDKGFKSVTTVNGTEIIQCVTPDGGWSVNPLAGAATPTAFSDDEKKLAGQSYAIGGPLYNYKEKGSTVELAGSDSVNGVKTIRLKVKDKNAVETYLSLDPTTYYILKAETKGSINGQEVDAIATFADYKKTETGYVLPFTTNRSTQGFDVTITHTKVEFNKDIDPKIFEMPKS
jgi:hypothetical protein